MIAKTLLAEVLPEPVKGQFLAPRDAMRLAIQEAFRGAGFVSPNPMVGCVVLDSAGGFLAKGFHPKLGERHAEIDALQKLSDSELKDSHWFVTLEPCAHQGRTGSCAKTLAALPIASVVYGLLDPNPLVSGKGALILNQAGVQTKSVAEFFDAAVASDLSSLLEQTCEHFLWNQRFKKPWISVKVATSLDGQMALSSGESQWITGEASRTYAHYLRAFHDLTMVGLGTIKTDNPSLNIRHPDFPGKKNRIAILDPEGWVFENYRLKVFDLNAAKDIFILTAKDKVPVKFERAQVIPVTTTETGDLDLSDATHKLYELGIRSILVEGGAKVISSFIKQRGAQRLYLFQAPMLMGGKTGRSWTENVEIHKMSDKIPLRNQRLDTMSDDFLFTGLF